MEKEITFTYLADASIVPATFHVSSVCVLGIEPVTLVLPAPCSLSYIAITKQKDYIESICRRTSGMSAMHGIMVTVSLLAVSVTAVF